MNSITSNQRLVIAYNPHSSRASDVREKVFDRLDKSGYSYETIEVQQASLEDNVARLAPLIQPNDVILSCAGDGSAHAVFHSVLAANQPGTLLGFLAFGNFNDLPHMFNTKESLTDPVLFLEHAKPVTIWPIQVFINKKPLRNALLYSSVGWTARAAGQFDRPSIRRKITHGEAGLLKSYWRLGKYYFKSRAGSGLPPMIYKDKTYHMTDLIFANGPTVARLFSSGRHYYKKNVFMFRMLDIRGVTKNIPFLISGLVGRMKGDEVTEVEVTFETPSSVVLQCDGEVVTLDATKQISVSKLPKGFTVLATK